MKIHIFQVDSFTDSMFGGYTSSVCALPKKISDELMQKIASETNLSKTAFLFKIDEATYEMRWFTPRTEITVSDHTSLASAYVIFNYLDQNLTKITLNSLNGSIEVLKENEYISLNFDARMPTLFKENNPKFSLSTGIEPLKVLSGLDYLIIYENEDIIKNLKPNVEVFKSLDLRGVCLTARGNNSDFVFKYFAPKLENCSDLVTGSICAQLVPYWAKVLDKNNLKVLQLSDRTSEMICDLDNNNISVKGKAKLFMRGEIIIEQRASPRESNSKIRKMAIAL